MMLRQSTVRLAVEDTTAATSEEHPGSHMIHLEEYVNVYKETCIL